MIQAYSLPVCCFVASCHCHGQHTDVEGFSCWSWDRYSAPLPDQCSTVTMSLNRWHHIACCEKDCIHKENDGGCSYAPAQVRHCPRMSSRYGLGTNFAACWSWHLYEKLIA